MERDHTRIYVIWRISNFNSHAHVERDIAVLQLVLITKISTHTLTWSVTCIIDKTIRFVKFQLTRSRGAWQYRLNSLHHIYKFQLTRSRGAWHECYADSNNFEWFQLTRSRGAWLNAQSKHAISINFNSHAHVERDVLKVVVDTLQHISTNTLTWSVTFLCFLCVFYFKFQLTRSRGAWLADIILIGVY